MSDQEVIDMVNQLYTVNGVLVDTMDIDRETLIFNLLAIKSLSDTEETASQIEDYNKARAAAGCDE